MFPEVYQIFLRQMDIQNEGNNNNKKKANVVKVMLKYPYFALLEMNLKGQDEMHENRYLLKEFKRKYF